MLKGILKAFRVLLSAILICIITFGIYYYLDKAFNNLEKNSTTNFKNFPDNTIDVIVLGTSQAQYSFDPAIFYSNTGLYSYVAGSSCQPMKLTYEMLKEVLKTQHPKLLILEVFAATPQLEGCMDENACYIIPLRSFTGQEKQNVIGFLSEDKANEYRYPLINNHNDWKNKEDIDFLKPENVFKKELERETGYIYLDGIEELPFNWWHAMIHEKDIKAEIDPIDLEALNNIYDLCKENDIKILLYKTQIDGIDEINQSVRHKVWEWAEERNIPYADFVDNSYGSGFYINIHTTSFHPYISGAAIVTTDLLDVIKTLNIEFDHHSNEVLDKMYHDISTDNLAKMLKYENDPKKYLETFSNGYFGTFYIRNNTHGDDISDKIYEYLRKIGANDINKENNYYAIINNGELVSYSNIAINEEYNGHKIVINSEGIFIDDIKYDDSNVYLSFVYETDKHHDNDDIIQITKNIDVFSAFDNGKFNYERDSQ